MKKKNKAALYSAIVFPGSGYFFTEKKYRGWCSLLVCIVILGILMREAIYKAQIIAEKIIAGEIPNSFLDIQKQIQSIPSIYSDTFISFTYGTLFIIWLAGIINSYQVAKSESSD